MLIVTLQKLLIKTTRGIKKEEETHEDARSIPRPVVAGKKEYHRAPENDDEVTILNS